MAPISTQAHRPGAAASAPCSARRPHPDSGSSATVSPAPNESGTMPLPARSVVPLEQLMLLCMNPARPVAPVLRSAAGLVADVFARDGGTGVAVMLDGETFRSFICRQTPWYTDAPLRVGGEGVAVVRVYWAAERDPVLEAGPARRLEAVARTLSSFVENHREAEARARRLRYARTIGHCGQLLLRRRSAEDTLGLVLSGLREATEATGAFLYRHAHDADGHPSARLLHWDGPSSAPDLPDAVTLPRDETPGRDGLGSGADRRAASGDSDPAREVAAVLSRDLPGSIIVQPVLRGPILWGFLGLSDREGRDFGEDETELVASVATMLSDYLLSCDADTTPTAGQADCSAAVAVAMPCSPPCEDGPLAPIGGGRPPCPAQAALEPTTKEASLSCPGPEAVGHEALWPEATRPGRDTCEKCTGRHPGFVSRTCLIPIADCAAGRFVGGPACIRRPDGEQDRRRLWRAIQEAVRTREAYGTAYRAMFPEGERWIWERGRGLYDDLGNLTGIRAVLTDVTASRRAFEAARLAAAETEGTRGDPVVLRLDTRGHIQFVSGASRTLLGYEPGQLTGRNVAEVLALPEGTDATGVASFLQLICDGEWPDDDLRVECRDAAGRRLWLVWRIRALRSETGRITGLICAGMDVTAHGRSQSHPQWRRSTARGLTSELLVAEQRERRYLAEALHDRVGQSLTGLQLRLQSLRDQLPPGSQREQADQITAILEDVIGESRALTFELSSFALYSLGLQAGLKGLVADLEDYGISGSFDCDPLPRRIGDAAGAIVFAAVRELLRNATAHSHADRVRVGAGVDGDHLEVTVADNGVGFSVAQIPGPADGRRTGLSKLAECVGCLGGELRLDSAPSAGTSVTIRVHLDATTGVLPPVFD